MASNRSTFPVRDIIAKANNYFAADHGSREGRRMLQSFVESILHETNNYRGFQYLRTSQVPPGALPGVIIQIGKDNVFPDDSRIYFYTNPALKREQTNN